MTVQELINKLETVEDKNQIVEVAIGQYNKRYPVAYAQIQENGYQYLQSDGYCHRIEVNLPFDNDNYMGTITRKQ